jgi:ribose/xylose/arabinose/galactoside ABC-type transport system permease subunit
VSPAALLRRFGPLLGLVALCAVLGTLSDHFLTFDNLINVFGSPPSMRCFRSANWW